MVKVSGDSRRCRNSAAFWILGLLNNFLYVVMNAGANNISEAGIGLVYLANVLPALIVKVTGPYWFDYVSYRVRIWFCSICMVVCLMIVAWGTSSYVKLIGVCFASLYSGIGEASMLGMAAFYDQKVVLTAWSSGTGMAGIAGYVWAIIFDALDTCFQVQLMAVLWIPAAWLVTFHFLLEPPWIDTVRDSGVGALPASVGDDGDSSASSSSDSEVREAKEIVAQHAGDRPVTESLSCKDRFLFILTLWPYMVPLILVYAAEYTIQAGFWATIGFPVTDSASRHSWYKWSNFTYQVGVFISRSTFVLVCKSRAILWMGAGLQVAMLMFFWWVSAAEIGSWWLLAPAFFVGLMGGGVYVGAFCLISQEQDPHYVELALTSASLGDSFGIVIADVLGIIVQGCMFGQLGVLDTKPDFTCGYTIWDDLNVTNVTEAAAISKICFPGVEG